MAHRRPVGRHLVLDNHAASALLRGPEAERRQVIEALAAADGGSVVPSAVRVEAGWDRRARPAGSANRLVPDDDAVLDRHGADRAADRAAELRASVAAASVVDACVAVAAEHAAVRGGPVEILTSDPGDMAALAAQLDGRFEIRRL